MSAVVSQPALLAALRAALLVVPNKGLPILANVLLRASGDRLTVTATDLERAIEVAVECSCLAPWSCCVPAKILTDVISEIPGGALTLEWSDAVYHIRVTSDLVGMCGRLAGWSDTEFPEVPAPEGCTEITFDPTDLARVKRMVCFAVSDDATRPALNGVLLRRVRKHLEATATDGYRLARINLPKTVCLEDGSGEWIVPPEAVSLAERLAMENEIIPALINDALIQIRVPAPAPLLEILVTSKLIDGPYPNTQQVIPKATAWSATIMRDDLLHVVRRVRVAAKQPGGHSHILFDQESNRAGFRVHGCSKEAGIEGADHIPMTGDCVVPPMAWDGKYLVEILGLFDSLALTVSGNAPLNATIWREPGDEDSRPLILLMPLRRGES